LKKLIFIIVLLAGSFLTTQAQQKIGHMNSGNVLEKLPDVINANKALSALQDSLKVELDTRTARFRSKYELAIKAVNEGTLTPAQQSAKEQELNQDQSDLQKFQSDAEGLIALRRQMLLAPVMAKLDNAVKAVGKENGYAFIFDQATGSMLYVTESDDVTKLVEKKLGI